MSEKVATGEDLEQWQRETPERRRLAWVRAEEGRTIAPKGEYWFAHEAGEEVDHHKFLSGLMDLLESPRPAVHVPAPREGEPLYRHGVRLGRAPRAADHPLTGICTCGVTIDRASADVAWAHREWAIGTAPGA